MGLNYLVRFQCRKGVTYERTLSKHWGFSCNFVKLCIAEVNQCIHPQRGNWSLCTDTWCKNGYCAKYDPMEPDMEVCKCDDGWSG